MAKRNCGAKQYIVLDLAKECDYMPENISNIIIISLFVGVGALAVVSLLCFVILLRKLFEIVEFLIPLRGKTKFLRL